MAVQILLRGRVEYFLVAVEVEFGTLVDKFVSGASRNSFLVVSLLLAARKLSTKGSASVHKSILILKFG